MATIHEKGKNKTAQSDKAAELKDQVTEMSAETAKKVVVNGDNKNIERRLHIKEMLKQHEEFIVIGLTGRIGSGCSEAADILGSSFTDISLPAIYPGNMGLFNDDERDRRILYRYASYHWLRFDVIKVRAVITSFLLENKDFADDIVKRVCGSGKAEEKDKQELLDKIDSILKERCALKEVRINKKIIEAEAKKIVEQINKLIECCKVTDTDTDSLSIEGIIEVFLKLYKKDDGKDNCEQLKNVFEKLYRTAEKAENYEHRIEWLRKTDELLNRVAAFAALVWWYTRDGDKNTENSDNFIQRQIDKLEKIGEMLQNWNKNSALDFSKYVQVHDIIPALSDAIHEYILEKDASLFTELYQCYGNSIRRYGKIIVKDTSANNAGKATSIGDNVLAIPRRINMFIKSMRHPFSREFAKPTRIAIDSIKSTLEANFLKERYSAFYLFAVSAEETVRRQRLMEKKNLNMREIRCIDWNEYPELGAEKYRRYIREEEKLGKYKTLSAERGDDNAQESVKQAGNSDSQEDKKAGNDEDDFIKYLRREKIFDDDELAFIKKVKNGNNSGIHDVVREEAYRDNTYKFVLQDVGASIQSADVFISNNHMEATKNMQLRWELVRNISLIAHPGLLLPTPIERCMQVAFTAKANSGCLSRQVGAVVSDAECKILSVGWNDVPCGDVSCARKNLSDIYKQEDKTAYTDYELYDPDFRSRVEKKYREAVQDKSAKEVGKVLNGVPWSYCFKDLHTDGKQPMRSRAMHAEEKALSMVHGEERGGYLFTTSSPCEMCSKNAKNHMISKIYYIEPYPGISQAQYSNSGNVNNRAKHVLFTGAIGRAYTQMYTPIMPHKDVLEFLGV